MAQKLGFNKRIVTTPVSSPTKHFGKKGVMETDAAENIIATLKMATEEQGALIGKSISDLQVTIKFISEDLKELKGKVTQSEKSGQSRGENPNIGEQGAGFAKR